MPLEWTFARARAVHHVHVKVGPITIWAEQWQCSVTSGDHLAHRCVAMGGGSKQVGNQVLHEFVVLWSTTSNVDAADVV